MGYIFVFGDTRSRCSLKSMCIARLVSCVCVHGLVHVHGENFQQYKKVVVKDGDVSGFAARMVLDRWSGLSIPRWFSFSLALCLCGLGPKPCIHGTFPRTKRTAQAILPPLAKRPCTGWIRSKQEQACLSGGVYIKPKK